MAELKHYLVNKLTFLGGFKMTSIVIELQRDALDRNVPISDLLRKALVVAKKLHISEFESWVNNELNGYERGEDISDYRQIRGKIKAWNPYHGWQPVDFEESEKEKALSRRACGQSIAEIESLVEGKSDKSLLQMPFPSPIEQQICRAIGFDTQITLILPSTAMVRIVDAVRTIILNWSLKLEEDGILGEEFSFTTHEKESAHKTSYNINMFYGPVQRPQIQQQAHQPVQVSSAQQFDTDAVKEFIMTLHKKIVALEISPEQGGEIESELKTVEAQINSPKPKHGIIKETLLSIKRILEGAGGGVAAQLLLQLGSLL